MPRKRKSTADAVDDPEPKRRVTRSSTAQELGESKPKTPVHKASKPPKASLPKAKKAKAKGSSPKEEDEVPNGPTTITISHNSVKNPISCHQYTSEAKNEQDAPTLIFTHGAGGTLSAPAVVNFCTGYSKGAPILAFQGSMNLKARAKAFHACISHHEINNSNAKSLVLGGRSMGARAAVIAASEHLASSSASTAEMKLVLVSYPLKGPKDDIRDQILLDLPSAVHVLFVIGDRDTMCPLDLLEETRKKMAAKSSLVIVKGADHGMHVKGRDREKALGEESGIKAFDWVSGKLKDEVIRLGEELDE